MSKYWYQPKLTWRLWPLVPFSWLFRNALAVRHLAYRQGWLTSTKFPVPVIIVGNINVGGTGKTPFVIWLVNWLQKLGYQPGVVSRGIGSQSLIGPRWVETTSAVTDVGDEALLIKRATNAPFVIDKRRVRAVQTLLAETSCNVVVADDGLQHYRLQRDLEIVMVDSQRLFGNQRVLPVGPLREPLARLKTVDFVVYNGTADSHEYTMHLRPTQLVSLVEPAHKRMYAEFTNKTIHAVAGIGYPKRFFDSLISAGFKVIAHPFPDHYHFKKQDLTFADTLPIVMTEKDAVKCEEFADDRFWYQATETLISPALETAILQRLEELICVK